jgi:hypothetical protein
MKSNISSLLIAGVALFTLLTGYLRAADTVVYEGNTGPGFGKHIVFLAGDEEYRSEESLVQMAKILAVRHGFKCTVLFSLDAKDGTIDPNAEGNLTGAEALGSRGCHLHDAALSPLARRDDEALRGRLPGWQADHRVAHEHSRLPIFQGGPLHFRQIFP